MTKKLIPAMVGAALVGGMSTAAADVQIFGHIDQSVNWWEISPNDGSPSEDDTNFICTTCSIGFKGSEDLGNGLKAIFSLDWQYDINVRNDGDGTSLEGLTLDNNNSGLLDRDQWVGLAGGFGKIRVGTISTGYKSHGAMIDPLYRTALQGRDRGLQSRYHSGAGEELEGRATNTLRYDSPDFNGLQVVAHYTLDQHETTPDLEDNNPFGIGASYSNGGIYAFADYITNDRGGSDDAWKVGGKFSMDAFSVVAQYESDGGLISSKGVFAPAQNTVEDADVWMIGGSYSMGNNLVYAAYGQGDDANTVGVDEGYDAWEIVGVHNLSKRTLAYLGYVNIDEDDPNVGVEVDWFTLGLKHKF